MNVIEATERSFQQDVLADKGVVLVDFWAAWCMPCRMLGPIVEKIARDYQGRIKVVKVNVDENPALSQRYDIMAIPTMIVFRQGEVVQRLAGLLPEPQLKRVIDQALAS